MKCTAFKTRLVHNTAFMLIIWCLIIAASLNLVLYFSKSSGERLRHRLLLDNVSESPVFRQELTITPESIKELEPMIDKSPTLSEAMMIEEIQRRLPSLPIAYWYQHKNKPMFFGNQSCARLPNIFQINFHSLYWQTLTTHNGTFHLFGAYYDARALNENGPSVRLLGMVDRVEPTVETHCQLWFEDRTEPVFSKVLKYTYIWVKEWGRQHPFVPYLITCHIPGKFKNIVPVSVSLVEKPCDVANNHLRVIYRKPEKKKGFGVCVKGLDFLNQDVSVKMVEWIELLGILGADKIFLYVLSVHPNTTKVFRYYEERGKIEVTPLTLAGGQPNSAALRHMYLYAANKFQHEVIPLNDCLYKNMYSYEYIASFDADEVIMPVKTMSWREMMDDIHSRDPSLFNVTAASYNTLNVYFLDDLIEAHGWSKDIPKYMHMLQHVYRLKNFTKPGHYVKSFHNPDKVFALHNHYPISCLGPGCWSYPISTDDAQLQHYRSDCVRELRAFCNEARKTPVMDTTIWKFKDKLRARTTETLRRLGFLDERVAQKVT